MDKYPRGYVKARAALWYNRLMSLAAVFLALLCDLASITDGGKSLYRSGEKFSVTGHVIFVNEKTRNVTFWQKPDFLVFHANDGMRDLRTDTLYRLDGHLELRRGWQKRVLAERLVPLRSDVFPEPVDGTPEQLVENKLRCRLVRIEGVVAKVAEDPADVRINWLTLKSGREQASAFVNRTHHPLDTLRPLVGATVRLVGVPRESVTWRSNLPPSLSLTRHRPIEVVTPAETDPEQAPAYHPSRNTGRQRVAGLVLARSSDSFYLDYRGGPSDMHVARIRPSAGQPMPRAGDQIVAAGFPALDTYHLQFDESLVKTVGTASATNQPPPNAFSLPELYASHSGNTRIAARRHGQFVRIRGTVRELPADAGEERRIEIEDGGRRLGIDVSALGGKLPDAIRPAAVIAADGILLVEFEAASSAYELPPFRRFTLLPRTLRDIRVLHRAPWWTPGRLLAVIFVLVGALVGTAIWNRQLKRLSEKRGTELYNERIAHAAAELKVAERTRLAVEIHDSISQTLTGIALQFDNGADPSIVRQMLASCRHELKSCIWDLRSRTFEEKDMTEAVKRAIGPSVGAAKVAVRFNVPRSSLSESVTHTILRIIRELVVNAVRHGKARHVRIAGEFENGVIRFSVTDDGKGFDPATAAGPSSGHFGLQGIRERLSGLQGEMTVCSSPGKTQVLVRLQLNRDEET